MRILMSAGFYDIGGSSTVMEQLANSLAENGHEVTIGALWFKHFPSKGAYRVVRIPMGNVLKLRRFLEGFDVVHNHHAITNYLALVSRKPFVYHYHGAPNFKTGYMFRLSMFSSIKLMKHPFDAVIAVSKSGTATTLLVRHFMVG
jgi:glycosyltransferase involved in cell wall biosynthesis